MGFMSCFICNSAFAHDHQLLNQEEYDWLSQLSRPLVVGTERNYHPYSFTNAAGEFDGVAGDYMRLVAERLDLEWEVRTYATFAEVLEAARNREIDMVAVLVAAPERRTFFDFTQPVFQTRDRIFTREEFQGTLTLDDLDDFDVGVVDGYALQAILAADYPAINVVPQPNEPDGLLALSLGQIDAFVSEIGTSTYYIQRDAITNLRVAGEVDFVDDQTFGTRNDWPVLNQVVGKALASITPAEHEEIQRRWINISGVDPAEVEVLSQRVTTIIGLGLTVLAIVLAWSFALRRLVARRTAELEQQLAETRAVEADKMRLAVAVEQSAEFVLVVDTDANIEYANHAFGKAIGMSGLQGMTADKVVTPASETTLSEAMNVAHDNGAWQGNILIAGADEQTIRAKMNVVPIYSDTGEIDGYVATGRDVTLEEQLEARVRQSERLTALGTLAGGIAHDFNNLLVPILGYADMIRARGSAELAPFLDGISDASERARDLVKRISVFGRGSTEQLAPLDLRYEIDDAITFVRHFVPATIAMHEDLEDCGSVMGDRTQIQQILLNLCSNAADAMPDGGDLTIKLEKFDNGAPAPERWSDLPRGEYALLTVVDTGVGMTETTKTHIFDPYYSEKRQAKGTGLGLAIVHGVVSRHDGHIYVQSEPGTGTTFQIFLPTIRAEVSEPRDAAVSVVRGAGEKVLLVDDDALVLSTIKNMLWGLGYEVDGWSDPAAALRAFQETPEAYDVVLSDYTMPGMNGLQFLKGVLEARHGMPAVIMSGNTSALEDYGGPFISKPMQVSELSRCLHEVLHKDTHESA